MNHEIKVLDNSTLNKKVGVVMGTRPGIVMFAPIIHELTDSGTPYFVIHTGQHYSPNMDSKFFEDLHLPEPNFKLDGVAQKKTHGGQTAAMIEGIEAILLKERPRLVLVGGDANTNLAGALAARKLRIQIGHVEAGERSYDWRMPEEHNRRIIDHISDHLFATGEKSKANLLREAVMGNIYITGNPIVDASIRHFRIAETQSKALELFGLRCNEYALLTTHREENVDFPEILKNILLGVSEAGKKLELPVLFLAHPRTIKRIKEFDLWDWLQSLDQIRLSEAVGYLDFLKLLGHARLVFTDSGGVQQEASIHHIPAVTLRENTEWIETLETGANRLAGTDPDRILALSIEAYQSSRSWSVSFGNGFASQKIREIVSEILNRNGNS